MVKLTKLSRWNAENNRCTNCQCICSRESKKRVLHYITCCLFGFFTIMKRCFVKTCRRCRARMTSWSLNALAQNAPFYNQPHPFSARKFSITDTLGSWYGVAQRFSSLLVPQLASPTLRDSIIKESQSLPIRELRFSRCHSNNASGSGNRAHLPIHCRYD